MNDNPLGKTSDYPEAYTPEVLHPIARSAAREPLGIGHPLPFVGEDIWNAWELSWLDDGGKPQVAIATLRVPANSDAIVESKSLKLYLNSFCQTRVGSATELGQIISTDLARLLGDPVDVRLQSVEPGHQDVGHELTPGLMPGTLIDDLDVRCDATDVDPTLLAVEPGRDVRETLHSHLLRSLCPVTGQPDSGSLLVSYEGPAIDRAGLLAYIVSFRRHNDFHEACIERMFMDIVSRCGCSSLTVYARYNRRGGIDINPYRSSHAAEAPNLRLLRQ